MATEIRKYHPNKVTLCSELPVSPGAFQTQHQSRSYMIFKRKGNALAGNRMFLGLSTPSSVTLLLQKKKRPKWKADLGGPEAIPLRVRSRKLTRDTELDASIAILKKSDSLFFLQLCFTACGKYLSLNLIPHQKKSNLSLILHGLITLGKSALGLFLVLTSEGSALLKCS